MQNDKRELPDGWRWVRLGDVCQIVMGKTPSRSNSSYWGGDLLWATITDLNESTLMDTKEKITQLAIQEERHRLVRAGTLLFSFKLTLGKMAVAGKDMFTNEAIAAITPLDSTVIDNSFLWFSLKSIDPSATSSHAVKGKTLNQETLNALEIPLPPLPEQRRIAAILAEQMAAVDKARTALEQQLTLANNLVTSYLRQSLTNGETQHAELGDCLDEVTTGVGATWDEYPVYGATRAGIALAKEKVGKRPERYKLVDPITVFYNPMRILLGSIAIVDEGNEPGITSPDYVVFKGREGILHSRWFYYWFRSQYGVNFIKTLSRGAVRERLLFKRLAKGEMDLPTWEAQLQVVARLKGTLELKRRLSDQLDALKKIPAALLRRAFNGEL